MNYFKRKTLVIKRRASDLTTTNAATAWEFDFTEDAYEVGEYEPTTV